MLNRRLLLKYLSSAGALIVLGSAGLFTTTLPGHSQQPPPTFNAKVVNTASNPVPTVAQGTTTISGNVGISPTANTVNAQQSGTWSVGITGTPTVKLDATGNTVQAQQSGTWNVGLTGTPTVTVGNSAGAPVLVRDVDNPARQPFQKALFGGDSFVAPAGKRLVIEYVSVRGSGAANDGNGFMQADISTTTNGEFASHRIPLTQDRVQDTHFYEGAESTRIYADPGTPVQFSVAFQSTTGLFSRATVSGYLVDLP